MLPRCRGAFNDSRISRRVIYCCSISCESFLLLPRFPLTTSRPRIQPETDKSLRAFLCHSRSGRFSVLRCRTLEHGGGFKGKAKELQCKQKLGRLKLRSWKMAPHLISNHIYQRFTTLSIFNINKCSVHAERVGKKWVGFRVAGTDGREEKL